MPQMIILGSGTVESKKRFMSSYLIDAGSQHILVDAGPGVVYRIREAGINLSEIGVVLITHLHADHSAGLSSFLWAREWGERKKRGLVIYGPRGIRGFVNAIIRIYRMHPTFPIRTIVAGTLKEASLSRGVSFLAGRVPHSSDVNSVAYSITIKGKKLSFTGDISPKIFIDKDKGIISKGLVKLFRGSDILVCDSSFPVRGNRSHISAYEAGILADGVRAGTLVLTHFYSNADSYNKTTGLKGIAGRRFRGRIIIADDMLRIKI